MFIIEGDKIVRDTLQNNVVKIELLAATPEWLKKNNKLVVDVGEIYETDLDILGRISSFETPPHVIATLLIPGTEVDYAEVNDSLSLGLDDIQDPGNLGTIIRTADWFGIKNVFCSRGCADLYNPKVIQASMGAIFNVKVHHTGLKELLGRLSEYEDFSILGTYMNGVSINEMKPVKRGIILFGNESRGLSDDYAGIINRKITITPVHPGRVHVESLNVASSVAAVLALITR